MDAETEVSRTAQVAECGDLAMDTDDSLDKLLRKAVTVSQANLPIATINKDIDDIASAYAKENERPDKALDDDFVRLLERTRQRRELLDQKMGKGPEAAPRKRRSPLCEDLTSNVGGGSGQTDDSPKRQCVREQELSIKPDTPAIVGVKSRLHAISTQRMYWAEDGTENTGDSSPVPTPRKSMVSPPVEPAKPAADEPGPTPQSGSQRKSRFAQLASSISSWEDDLSHPSIMKEEEKKSRWQPPKARENSPPAPSNSAKGSHDPAPTSASVGSKKSPVKSAAKTVDSASTSSVRPGTNAGGSGVAQTSRSPVKSSASSRPDPSKKVQSSGSQETEAEQEKEDKPRKEAEAEESQFPSTNKSWKEEGREMQGSSESTQKDSISSKREETRREALKPDGHKTGLETPKAVIPPTERPLSARLANWEQKISNSKSEAVSTPKPTPLDTSGKATPLPKKGCTPARPLSTPLIEESEAVQMRPKARRTVEDEPTAHSVSARMSAWEQISSNQEVGSIKKVKPGDCTPAKTPAAQKSPMKTGATATPAKPLAQEGIKERIAQLSTPQRAANTPGKTSALVGSATKSAQWQSAQQSNSSDVAAQRLRQARMAELQGIQSRWKNGILKEDASQQPEEAPTAESSAKKTKRQGLREKARADEREADSIEISATEDTNLEDENIKKISSGEGEEEKMTVDPEISAAVKSEVQTADSTCTATNKEKQSTGQDILDQKSENINSAMPNENPQSCKAVHTDGQSVDLGNATQDASQQEIHGESPTAKMHLEGAARQEVILDQNGMTKEQGSVQPLAVQTDGDGQSGEQTGGADGQTHTEGHPEDSTDGTSGQKNTSTGASSPTNTRVEPMGICSQTACDEEKKELASTELPEASETSNFDSKLAAVGIDAPNKDTAACNPEEAAQDIVSAADATATCSSQAAPATSSTGVVSGKPPRPTSLFSIVSQQKAEGATTSSPRPITSKVCRKVKFDDSFDSEDSEAPDPKKAAPEVHAVPEDDDDGPAEEDMEVVLRRPRQAFQQQQQQQQRPLSTDDENDDDVSMSAFVPRSVRFQNVLPSGQDMDTSINSLDSFDGAPGAPPDFHKSTVDLVKLGQQYADSDSCSSLDTVAAASTSTAVTAGSSRDSWNDHQQQQHQGGQDLEDSVDDRDAIGDLLDEAMDSEEEEVPVMRKKNNPREATGGGDLPFSINEYRASRNIQIQEVKQTIVRNSQYVGMSVKEEDVEMPTAAPTPAPRRSAQDKIRELQELVQQEQSVIMQTSNALNQCCSSTSYFAGSSEQVECNRILLISCQKRQAYMTEIQRLKDGSVVEASGPSPKGSVTISDIRLPLKKDFVTKIGTSQDTMTYYFILLVRNGPQVITTQMLSTHDPMMRGSLDFPNLIKVNGITGSFKLQMDIYSMSVSCEALGKDRKKKTPKKFKGSALAVQSPGGPMAVRMTSFTQVTTVHLTMKSVDKHCFSLDRLSHLSPLHGTIYMNLKCLMEANVEEKGFLTMFEDVSGLGSWHRRWCVLSGNRLQFWKYPDDETKKEPMGYVDLKRCVTEKVGLISRDVCARPHTFELSSVRQPKKGEKDTLVSRTYSTMTTVRHMLSADTKEERIVWCNKINRALATIRTWHTDAMRPIPK